MKLPFTGVMPDQPANTPLLRARGMSFLDTNPLAAKVGRPFHAIFFNGSTVGHFRSTAPWQSHQLHQRQTWHTTMCTMEARTLLSNISSYFIFLVCFIFQHDINSNICIFIGPSRWFDSILGFVRNFVSACCMCFVKVTSVEFGPMAVNPWPSSLHLGSKDICAVCEVVEFGLFVFY